MRNCSDLAMRESRVASEAQKTDQLITAVENKSILVSGCMSRMRIGAVHASVGMRSSGSYEKRISSVIKSSIMLPNADIK